MGLFSRRGPKEERNVLNILEREYKFFLRLYSIADRLHKYAESENIKETHNYFKELKGWERREQSIRWGARVSKLKGAINELLKLPRFAAKRREIEELVNEMKIFEGDLLKRTVEDLESKLEPIIEGMSRGATIQTIIRMQRRVVWPDIIKIAYKLMWDLRALTALDEKIKKIIEG